ncbi:ABC transporter permease [Arthrobacter sp. H5]|uniref:ABC transporter permease n=1 Tax=Arthrobacter sp. H5 TaxID=1267973 RepID=UPI0004BB6856|nr:ABC transporter permease [Arthrobacter sp. H5]
MSGTQTSVRDPHGRAPSSSPVSLPPGTQPPWLIVTLREVLVKAKDRGFAISTMITLVLIVAGVVFNAFMANRGEDFTVMVTSDAGQAVIQLADEAGRADDGNVTFTAVTADDDDGALEQVRTEDADAALLQESDGIWTLTGKNEVSTGLAQQVGESLDAYVLDQNAAAAGTTGEDLLAGSELEESLLEGSAENQLLATIAGFIFSFLFYMASIIFGMAIANSVVEEKQNRVVEILATAIPIRQLLYGKVLGNTILAMVQLALYGGAALLALNLTDTADLVGSIIPASGWFMVFFLFGFLILAAIWAVLGSLASRPEDLTSNSAPVMALIFAALFAGLFASGQLLVVASYVPVVSSVAMPIRMLNSPVALWEPLLSLVIALAAAVALLHLGEKIYRRAVMQSGGALTLRKALKLEQ